MPTCVVPTCKNAAATAQKSHGITFHLFPADEERKSQWTKIIQKARLDEFWKSSKRSVICSIHFEEQYIYCTKSGLKRLKKEAYPNKNLALAPGMIETPAESSDLPIPWIDTQPSSTISNSETDDVYNLDLDPVKPNTSVGISGILKSKTNIQPELVMSPQSHSNIDVDISDLEHVFDTPRKVKLKAQLRRKQMFFDRHVRKIKTLQQKNRRLSKKNESLKSILRNLKDNRYVNPDAYEVLSTDIVAADIFNNLYNKNILNKKKTKYTSKIKKFCLTLNFLSPTAYNYVRATFQTCLPHPKTLSKWYSNISGEPGFSDESFEALKAKAASSERKIICSLMADEMSIRQQSLWDGKKNSGYVDMGTGTSENCQTLASEAYVLLVNGINDHFKLPLGYFLVHGLTAEQKVNLIKLCLIKCHDAGIKVASLTFDGHSTNLTVMKLLGCKIDTKHELKTTFRHPVDKYDVAVFLDPVHMFKLVRNHWESKKVIIDSNNNKIDWNLLCELNKLQEDEGLHFANKITRRHITFRNNIMKVKLASQVLSTSVATALKFCRENAKLITFKNSEPTEHFVRNMNNLFDVFNSRNMKQFDYKQPLYSRNKDFIFSFLNSMKTYIRELKIKQATKRKIDKEGKKVQVILQSFKPILECSCKTGFLGILIGIESLQSLYISLVEEDNMLVFIPSYKYCQDHLELLFGMIRMHGGHNNNPNAKQFKGIYRKVLCNLEIKASDNGNCIPLESIGVLNCSSSIKVINGSAQSQKLQEEQQCNDSMTITETCSSVVKLLSRELPDIHDLHRYIVGYISGSVAHYLLKVIKCEFCVDALQASNVLWFHKLISLKNRGGLCFPSQSLYDVCCICEAHVRRIVHDDFVVTSNTQRLAIVLQIYKKFFGNCGIFMFEENHVNGQIHKNSLIRAVIEKYLDIRLHHVSKCKTLKMIPDSKRQYYNKLTQQKGT